MGKTIRNHVFVVQGKSESFDSFLGIPVLFVSIPGGYNCGRFAEGEESAVADYLIFKERQGYEIIYDQFPGKEVLGKHAKFLEPLEGITKERILDQIRDKKKIMFGYSENTGLLE